MKFSVCFILFYFTMFTLFGQLDTEVSGGEKAFSTNDKIARVYLERGKIRKQNGDVDTALADFEKALLFDPSLASEVNALRSSHSAKQWLKRAKEALFFNEKIHCYQKAIDADSNCRDAYIKLGKIFFEKKRFDSSKEVWEKLLEIDPSSKDAKKYLKKIRKLGKS